MNLIISFLYLLGEYDKVNSVMIVICATCPENILSEHALWTSQINQMISDSPFLPTQFSMVGGNEVILKEINLNI